MPYESFGYNFEDSLEEKYRKKGMSDAVKRVIVGSVAIAGQTIVVVSQA